MNNGGAGQGGQGGAGLGSGVGSGSGSQNNGQETTTTSAQQQQTTASGFITTPASPQTETTTATNTPTPTSTSSPSSSSGTQKTAIIGGVIGGIASLLLIALLALYLLNRRRKKRIAGNRGSAQPVTYASLNTSFAGVPFNHSNYSSQHDSLLPPQAVLAPNTHQGGVDIRGGEGHEDVEGGSRDYFLPTYAESQAGMSLGTTRSLRRLNTSTSRSGTEATVSPMSVHHPGGTPTTVAGVSPQMTGGEFPFMPQIPRERDTMGFPVVASDIGIPRSQSFPIVAPVPRHPLVHQDSLERVAEGGLNGTPVVQNMTIFGPRGPTGRVLSQELVRESPVLGEMNPVRMQVAGGHGLGNGVQRFESQRTVSSMSSMGVSIVSDTELERLGVGSRGRQFA